MWLWQVCRGSEGYPWYGRTYNMALEPWTSFPSSGIAEAIKSGTALHLDPAQRIAMRLRAIVYTGSERVSDVRPDGTVERRHP